MAKKNQAAVSLGKLRMKGLTDEERTELARSGGLKGGKKRAAALTKTQRSAIAKKAAEARWGKKDEKKGNNILDVPIRGVYP